jgi:phage protein D
LLLCEITNFFKIKYKDRIKYKENIKNYENKRANPNHRVNKGHSTAIRNVTGKEQIIIRGIGVHRMKQCESR